MSSPKGAGQSFARLLTLVVVLAMLGCTPLGPPVAREPTGIVTRTAPPLDPWADLLRQTPVSHTAPLPPAVITPLDGTFAKLDESVPQWWLCLRCADYRPAGGVWKLQLERGVFRLAYEVTGWRTLASYEIDGDRLRLFNDPVCPDATGHYRWTLSGGALRLVVVDDACAFGLRGRNLALQPWNACGAPDATRDQDLPAACEAAVSPGATGVPAEAVEGVVVFAGDARKRDRPPEIVVVANTADRPAPEEFAVAYHPGSVPYGSNRILWQGGDWIEAESDAPLARMGVQFLGSYITGWARVLFDGLEVWRGDTAAIWSSGSLHGGYIEVSVPGPGPHRIRVERLTVDSRPVEVLFFGFDPQR